MNSLISFNNTNNIKIHAISNNPKTLREFKTSLKQTNATKYYIKPTEFYQIITIDDVINDNDKFYNNTPIIKSGFLKQEYLRNEQNCIYLIGKNYYKFVKITDEHTLSNKYYIFSFEYNCFQCSNINDMISNQLLIHIQTEHFLTALMEDLNQQKNLINKTSICKISASNFELDNCYATGCLFNSYNIIKTSRPFKPKNIKKNNRRSDLFNSRNAIETEVIITTYGKTPLTASEMEEKLNKCMEDMQEIQMMTNRDRNLRQSFEPDGFIGKYSKNVAEDIQMSMLEFFTKQGIKTIK